MAVFWDVAPCSLVEVYQRFGGPCCLHHQGDVTAVRTSNFIKCVGTGPAYVKLSNGGKAWNFMLFKQ
jgi:hypothetical protein